MPSDNNYIPRAAIFLAGVAAAAFTLSRKGRAGADPAALDAVKRSIADLETRVQSRENTETARLVAIEGRLDEQAAKLSDVPSTSQIVAAMEQLLAKTMTSLDERLTGQARSIEVLKTTVAQTDSLLERVLESLDTLQAYSDPAEFVNDPLLSRPAV